MRAALTTAAAATACAARRVLATTAANAAATDDARDGRNYVPRGGGLGPTAHATGARVFPLLCKRIQALDPWVCPRGPHPDPDSDAMTATFWACRKGFPDIVRLLRERGADMNLRSYSGLTPFMGTRVG